MLKDIDLLKEMKKKEYGETIEKLQFKLSELQRQAKELKIPIILVFEGWEAAGKGTLINELIFPLDPRGFNVYATNELSEEEKLKPFLWRFWTRTPAKGRIAIFEKSWYRRTLVERMNGSVKGEKLEKSFEDIRNFEKHMVDDGNLVIKFFIHISKAEQKLRFEKLESDSAAKWRVTKEDWKQHNQYDKYVKVFEDTIKETDEEYAPWVIVEGNDKRYATVKIFKTIIQHLENKISKIKETENNKNSDINESVEAKENYEKIISKLDLSLSLSKEEYKEKLKIYQKKIREIEYEIYTRRIPVMILFEGSDAAGKGGNIKRITQNLDPRGYQVVPIAAPSSVELSHHYFWRFWNEIPKSGHITIFDRTYYGRVLVERVEGFCSKNEWQRAYNEINEMEQQLTNAGTVIIKFWLQIDKDEQLKRFNDRQNTPEKQWKITDEDWRNREKWDAYEAAVDEMIIKTSTKDAPWTTVESNSKYYARLKTLKTIIDVLEEKIKEKKKL